ncbi:class I SAM-dependent methyltransferase [Streptomyces sp. NRRL WC-3725]|uniref:class I SAM-dependent methyltransferase n=1 Tax=Streptomyces sp. NRRL WC-3725 TaxID=1463933 RepID=UPI0004C74E8C|nr:class I SAM-dependent methyltransferase [Streptomyces sp. NRRL WC-3725]
MTETSSTAIPEVMGVGLTAFLVAAARAIETSRPDALARDEYAEHFVRAAPGCAGWPRRFDEVPGGDADPLWGRLARFFALRTRAFDDFVLDTVAGGCRQVVMLGAGLDTRAYRLAWPEGCTVFEVDQPEVLALKQSVLDGLSAVPRATRVAVTADLRHDWIGALTAAGFDPTRPTAWLSEGVMPYLSPAVEQELLAVVDAHSASGSVLGFEAKVEIDPDTQQHYPIYAAARERLDMNLLDLFNAEPRTDPAADLETRGWSTDVHTVFDFAELHGIALPRVPDDGLADNRWVFASR